VRLKLPPCIDDSVLADGIDWFDSENEQEEQGVKPFKRRVSKDSRRQQGKSGRERQPQTQHARIMGASVL
jgi:hypothetical protein